MGVDILGVDILGVDIMAQIRYNYDKLSLQASQSR